MIPDRSKQEFIDLLSRMANSDDVEEGEIIILNGDEQEEEGEILADGEDVEDGEITGESAPEVQSDDAEEINLRLKALNSLSNVKKKARRSTKIRRKRIRHDDVDLRSSSTTKFYSNSTNDDREYLLDKDYRQPSVFDMLFSLITPESRASYPSRQLNDNYDVQQMDIVDDQPTVTVIPPPPPPPLPPPPPPPPLFYWPRPTFLPDPWLNSLTSHTDVDLRQLPPAPAAAQLPSLPPVVVKRKRTRKHRREKKKDDDDEDEEERRLREELLKTISIKRQPKPTESERIVTIVSTPTLPIVQPVKPIENQYSVNNRYKRVKANASSTNLASKVDVRPVAAPPIIQTRNKIVRMVRFSLRKKIETILSSFV